MLWGPAEFSPMTKESSFSFLALSRNATLKSWLIRLLQVRYLVDPPIAGFFSSVVFFTFIIKFEHLAHFVPGNRIDQR